MDYLRRVFLVLILGLISASATYGQQKTKNVIIVTLDGYRWKELFQGPDSTKLFGNEFTTQETPVLVEKYWGQTEQERRKKITPFIWNVIGKKGQIYGNEDLGNFVKVTNKYWFSFPGYSEMFTGYADPAINSNEYPPNPNVNVLEFINKQPGFKGKVAAFASWYAMDNILNKERSGFLINSGWTEMRGNDLSATQRVVSEMQRYSPTVIGGLGERIDVITYMLAREYLRKNHPRVLYVSFGFTDAFAHKGKYDYYLDAAHHADAMIANLWETIQKDPFYRNKTTLFITTDHGRGYGKKWKSHNAKTPHSDEIWFAVMGPDTPSRGEIKQKQQLHQCQFAQTIAHFLGLNFSADHPICPALSGVIQ